MRRQGPISLADFIRAVETLRIPTSDTRRRRLVARMLGLDWLEEEAGPGVEPPSPKPDRKEPQEPAQELEGTAPLVTKPPEPNRWNEPPSESRRRTLQPSLVRRREVPAELLNAPVLAEPAPVEKPRPLPYEPLFRREWSRHILTGTLATRRPEGPIDLEEVVRKIGRGEAFHSIPQLPWSSLKRRVHLLIDHGPGMEPFRKDQLRLAEEFERVVGYPRLMRFNFRACPTLGAGTGPVFAWTPYTRPDPGTAVVLLSDAGAAPLPLGASLFDLREWLDFAEALAHASVPLLCLSPYPNQWVPEPLRPWLTWIHWDRNTTPGRIRRRLYSGLRAARR